MSSCHSCLSCQTSCTTCQGTCNSCQSFCERGGQSVGSFDFNQCVSSGEVFLKKTNWNRLITYINNAYDRGSLRDGGDSGLPVTDPNEYMTAEMFNDVVYALRHLGSSYSNISVSQGDVIYGSYFETLENYADNLLYKNTQCNTCNISCDVTCNRCQGCNTHSNSCCSSCNVTCESDNPT